MLPRVLLAPTGSRQAASIFALASRRRLPGIGALQRRAATTAGAPQGPPRLVSATGSPLQSPAASSQADATAIVQLNQQNAMQVLRDPGAYLLMVGSLPENISKKIQRLRVAGKGWPPMYALDCATLPQVCQALQIQTSPTVLLMVKGQVVAALENDLSLQAATNFVERAAKICGLDVDLGEGVMEQISEAEEMEWSNHVDAAAIFDRLAAASDLPLEARIRTMAGQARCSCRAGDLDHAKAVVDEIVNAGQGTFPEVKQAAALLTLHGMKPSSSSSLEELSKAAGADPADVAAGSAYAVALFWAHKEQEAVAAALAVLRKKRSDDAKKLARSLVEALGPHHSYAAKARKALSNALFA